MYKMVDKSPGRYVTQIGQVDLVEVEVRMFDNRDPDKGTEDWVFFLVEDENSNLREQVEMVCEKMGYTLCEMGDFKRMPYTFEVGKTMVRLAQQNQ